MLGRMITSTDGNGNKTEYTYNVLGLVTNKKVPFALDNGGNIQYTNYGYTYDAAGNVIKDTVTDGVTNEYAYDYKNNVIRGQNFMNFMLRGKKGLIVMLTVLILIFFLKMIQLIEFPPIKKAVNYRNIYTNKGYIVCEYVETTGFLWRIMSSNLSIGSGKYVKFINQDISEQLADQVLYGENTFVFYGKCVEDDMSSIALDGEYITFCVDSWDIIKPVKRMNDFNCFFAFRPSEYLYEDDFK